MKNESSVTREFCDDCAKCGVYPRALAGSMLQKGLPDRMFINALGTILLVEFKARRGATPPTRATWRQLGLRGPQHEFFLRANSSNCAVVVQGETECQWSLYTLDTNEEYVRRVYGRDKCIEWVCDTL